MQAAPDEIEIVVELPIFPSLLKSVKVQFL